MSKTKEGVDMIEVNKRTGRSGEIALTGERETQDSASKRIMAQQDMINAYRVAEFVTLAGDGSPVCWPLAPGFDGQRLAFNTGYVYPTKARNAQRNPRVAALFSDPSASGRSDGDPFVLVQGLAEVFDQNLQQNTERYVDWLMHKGPRVFAWLLHVPGLRQRMVGYLTRIWIEVIPQRVFVWARGDNLPAPLRKVSRPTSFSPKPSISLGKEIFKWLPRYSHRPVLSYLDATGWPAMIRVQATVTREHIALGSDVETCEGAPACLIYHRLSNNWVFPSNDAFLIRGHFNAEGSLIPEKLVGFAGTKNDRGVGSLKVMRLLMRDYYKQLSLKLAKEGRPIPIVRPTPKRSI